MPTNQSVFFAFDEWLVDLEYTITAAGAIVPNADGSTTTIPGINATRTGAGTYRIDIPGNFSKVLNRHTQFHAAAASSQQSQITAIGLGTGTPGPTGEAVTTVTVITGNSNAVPAAADQASGTIGVQVKFQKHKM